VTRPSDPSCTAIIVTFNSQEEIVSCLESLEGQQDVTLTIHVVDNASRDQTATLVRKLFPHVELVVSESNLGFGQANNLALERLRTPFFAVVNPDTVLPPEAIRLCLDYLKQNPSAGIVGTRLESAQGEPQRTGHAFLGLRNLFAETFWLDRVLPERGPSLRGWRFGPDYPSEVDWLPGAFLVFRREVIDQIGVFDPQFFMYGEEMDLCRRARQAGWRVVYLPEPTVVHIGGASSRPLAGPMFVENLKGRLRFLRKHRGAVVAWGGGCLMAVSVFLRYALREAHVLALRAAGRAPDASLLERRAMFRNAARWVLGGMSLGKFSP
jgi:N-acetylglucosaminyl-diphospho-decaprenol L-rhamnosyltransferase